MKRLIKFCLLTFILIMNSTSTVFADTRQVLCQFEEEYPPYRYVHNGFYEGFEVDFTNLIFIDHNYEIGYSSDSWNNIYNNLKNGYIDTCGLLSVGESREGEILYSKPLMEIDMAVYSRRGIQKVSPANINNYRVGVSTGRFTDSLKESGLNIEKYKIYPSILDAVEALKYGDIDLLIENCDVVDNVLIKNNLVGDITPNIAKLYSINIAYGVKKGETELVNYINSRIDELQKVGVYEELYQSYFHSHSSYYLEQSEIKKRNAIILTIGSITLIFIILYIYIILLKKRVANANRELYENNEQLRVTLSSIGEGVIAADRYGKIKYINKTAEKLISGRPDDIIGLHIDNVFTVIESRTRERVNLHIQQTIDSGKEQKIHGEIILLSRNGTEYPIKCSVMPIKSDDYFIVGAEIVFQNLAERKAAGEIIKRERDFSNRIFEYAGMFILVFNPDGRLLKISKYTEIATGYTYGEVSEKKWINLLIHKNMQQYLHDIVESTKNGRAVQAHEMSFITKNGRMLDILWNNNFIFGKNGNIDAVIWMGLDITERKASQEKIIESYQQLEAVHEELTATEEELRYQYDELRKSQEALRASEERYRLAMDGSADGLWDYDIKKDKLFYSFRCMEILGYGENIIGGSLKEWVEFIHADDRDDHIRILNEHFSGKTEFFYHEYRIKTKSGDYKWVLSRGKAVADSSGEMVRITGSLTDITERREADNLIHKMAYYDSLTGLPNRTMLYSNILIEIERVKAEGGIIGVLFMDLDNFKPINDTLGHGFGDIVLSHVGEMFKRNICEQDTVARQSGDEFVIVLSHVTNVDGIKEIAERIVGLFQQPLSIRGHELYISVSIGIAVYPFDGNDEQTLIKNADTAMYHAKQSGKNNYKFYTNEMHTKIVNKLNLEGDLRHAIKNSEFTVFYQPLVDLKKGVVIGLEALVRWIKPGYGCISPGDFIPLAEESGLIFLIDQYVLRMACMQCAAWQKAGIPPVKIAVNLSARQFQQDVVESIKNILTETGLGPEWLSVEITESIALKDLNSTVNAIVGLKKLGIEVSLDDFGTGYSSLSYLKRLPIDKLKIDKSFILDNSLNEGGSTIITAIIMLAQSMGINVVAEGVETYEQVQFLKEHNCDIAQGFIFGKPVSSEDIVSILRKRKVI